MSDVEDDLTRRFIRDTRSLIEQTRAALLPEVSGPPPERRERILIIGMGGSAICGDLLADMMFRYSEVPITVLRSPTLPRWVDRRTQVLVVSYSGGTMETLLAAEGAHSRGASICAVTSGGRLLEMARERSWARVVVPAGMYPRAALGSLLGACARIVDGEGIPAREVVGQAVDECGPYSADIHSGRSRTVERVAERLALKAPVVYASLPFVSAARRWMTQFNENAKMRAFVLEFPESAHNDIVGLARRGDGEEPLCISLRWNGEPEHLRRMYDVFTDVTGVEMLTVMSPCRSESSSVLYHVLVGDAVSLRAAEIRRVDPADMSPISEFKRRL